MPQRELKRRDAKCRRPLIGEDNIAGAQRILHCRPEILLG